LRFFVATLIGAATVLSGALGAMGVSAQPAAPEVVIPNFWDPAIRTARPPPGTIRTIRFVTTDDFPPFNYLDGGGRLSGFNVDLARAICDELAVECTVQVRSWDDLVPALTLNAADAAIAGVAISSAARQTLGFSNVYLRFPGRFAVRRGLAIEISAASLSGRRIAVAAGSAHEAYLATYFPGALAVPYATPEAAYAALRSGQADAAFGDGLQLSFWLQGATAGDCCEFAGGPFLDSHFFGEGLAVAVRSGDAVLAAAINAAMEALYERGIYAELYLRYLPIGFY
jgi:polar amino acid transport system substrate-binding protein